ncbi:MAG: 30S ribosomal protein S20 [Parachlamydiales bacterium]|nr:30S ribosomal protein S20 [Parachlamydiales bacterium]
MAEEENKKKKQKIPTAQKRITQSIKRQANNKTFKAKTKTALKSFLTSLETKEDAKNSSMKLSTIFSLVDKGVKKNIFKPNKANRIKAKYSKLLAK